MMVDSIVGMIIDKILCFITNYYLIEKYWMYYDRSFHQYKLQSDGGFVSLNY